VVLYKNSIPITMKRFLSTLILLGTITLAFSKSPVDIKITYDNYDNDTLLIAYYYGEKILIQDSLYATSKGKFHYKRDSLLEPGMYMLVTKPNNAFFQFLINEEDQQFEIKTDNKDQNKTMIKGSEENETFYNYIDYLSNQRVQLAAVDTSLSRKEITQEVADEKKDELANKVEAYQRELINKHKGWVLSSIISANMTFEVPDFDGTPEEQEIKRYKFYRKKYLEGVDLGNPSTLRTPSLHKKIEFYTDKLTAINADSINHTLEL